MTWSIDKVWQYSWSVNDASGPSAIASWTSRLWRCFSAFDFPFGALECLARPLLVFCCFLSNFGARQTFFQWFSLPLAPHVDPWPGHKDRWEISGSVPRHPHKRIMRPRGLLRIPLAFEEAWQCFSASTRVGTLTEIPFSCLLVTSSVLVMCRAVSMIRVASFSRRLVSVCLELDPKIRASIIYSSGSVKWHSSRRIRIFFTNGIDFLIGFLSQDSEPVPCESKIAFWKKIILEARSVGA